MGLGCAARITRSVWDPDRERPSRGPLVMEGGQVTRPGPRHAACAPPAPSLLGPGLHAVSIASGHMVTGGYLNLNKIKIW